MMLKRCVLMFLLPLILVNIVYGQANKTNTGLLLDYITQVKTTNAFSIVSAGKSASIYVDTVH